VPDSLSCFSRLAGFSSCLAFFLTHNAPSRGTGLPAWLWQSTLKGLASLEFFGCVHVFGKRRVIDCFSQFHQGVDFLFESGFKLNGVIPTQGFIFAVQACCVRFKQRNWVVIFVFNSVLQF